MNGYLLKVDWSNCTSEVGGLASRMISSQDLGPAVLFGFIAE